ncbi:MAG TPA: hydroxymethylglutaryl-CoA synthase [Polyangiaceae bacterium]|nr:hydroxymethylglutaryl-CoA synthase [Polyangiaceae bacterium]
MKTLRPVGIWGHGAYVPRFRIRTEDIVDVWRSRGSARPSVSQKSVLGPDEDTITMAIEAARISMRRSGIASTGLGGLWVGTESKPYAVKPSATLVASALGTGREILTTDVEFACKAGSIAMHAAVSGVGSGMMDAALAIGVDAAQSRPGDVLEYTAGCAAAAVVMGPADGAIAIVDEALSYSSNTPDFYRRKGAAYPQHGGRFTEEPGYFHHTLAASRLMLEKLGASPSDFQYAVFHQPIPKLVERSAKILGFDVAQVAVGMCANRIGNAYAGSSMLGLAAVLDVAKPGERIFYCSYGSGAGSDVFAFTVTDRILSRRDNATVQRYLDRAEYLRGYGQYLRLTDAIRM